MSQRPAGTMLPPSYGARNEASVLFRVDQLAGASLTARPRSPEPAAIASPSSSDDEGVIDLKSLSSAPPGIGASPLGRRASAIVAPLFSEPPPMAVEVDSRPLAATSMGRGKLVAMIAGALAVMMILGFGISLVFRGEERKPVVAAAPPAPPPPAPVVATPPPPVVDAPKVAAAEEGPAEESAPKKKKKKGAKGAAAVMKGKPKAADPCGCHGDFSCILACSAKGKM